MPRSAPTNSAARHLAESFHAFAENLKVLSVNLKSDYRFSHSIVNSDRRHRYARFSSPHDSICLVRMSEDAPAILHDEPSGHEIPTHVISIGFNQFMYRVG
jgi:hypothetical protein